MTRYTRSGSKTEHSITNNSNSIVNNRTLRPRKTKILYDSSDDEFPENWDKKILRTPKKDNLKVDNAVTPPKQKKTDILSTPQHKIKTPNVQTPSTLLDRLSLTSPVRTKISHNRKSLFPDKTENTQKCGVKNKIVNDVILISSDDENCDNDKDSGICTIEERDNELEKYKINSYRKARKALHSSLPTNLPGREKELKELEDFIKTNLENSTSGSMYVSGPPGTGKTASLSIILQSKDVADRVRHVYVNCTAIKSPTAIYSRIAKELSIKVSGRTERDYLHGIENYLIKSKKVILMVLDEIDQLENKNQSILYTIFEWPSRTHFKMILIGIANALDLTDRTLPRLQAKCELKPKLMHFAPYTKEQIVEIFTGRLKEAGALEVFSPVALQMLAAKVAAVSGDVRRALDIGRRVVELIDNNRECDTLKSIENIANDLVDSENKETKKVDLKEVLTVLNNVYCTAQNLVEDNEDAFPLQQKVIICSLLLMLKKAKNKDITVGKLHEVYKRVCTKRNILAVDQSEFVGLCTLIETRGIIRVSGKKEPRLNKVHLEWDEEEVGATLKDKQLMSMILQDDSCLGRL